MGQAGGGVGDVVGRAAATAAANPATASIHLGSTPSGTMPVVTLVEEGLTVEM
jgi:hypothetical protein